MPVHIEHMKTDVTTIGGEQPWTQDQIEMLIKLVVERLDKRERDRRDEHDETRLRPNVQAKPMDD